MADKGSAKQNRQSAIDAWNLCAERKEGMPEKFTLALEQEAPTPATQPDSTIAMMPIEQIEMEIKARAGMITENIIIIGKMLMDVKGRLEHGKFLNWLREKVNFSQSTANNFMRIAREIPKTPGLVNLPYTKALALLDVPESEREQFAQENSIDEKSTRQIQQLIKDKEDAEKAAASANAAFKQQLLAKESAERNAAHQSDLAQQYSDAYYKENERANLLESQLKAAMETQPEPATVTVEVSPPDYEHLKAQANEARQRADEAEQYAMEQEAERQRMASELRKLKETRADMPLQGNSPLSIDAFSSTVKQFMGQLGMAPNMAPFFRAKRS